MKYIMLKRLKAMFYYLRRRYYKTWTEKDLEYIIECYSNPEHRSSILYGNGEADVWVLKLVRTRNGNRVFYLRKNCITIEIYFIDTGTFELQANSVHNSEHKISEIYNEIQFLEEC